MLLACVATGSVYFVHADHLGTPQRLTDDTGAVVWDADYRPFGEAAVSGSVAFNLRFPGQHHDQETGLAYNMMRDYDAGLGRYVQSDPVGLSAGWNTYAYVGGNPVMFIDPRGLDAVQIKQMVEWAAKAETDLPDVKSFYLIDHAWGEYLPAKHYLGIYKQLTIGLNEEYYNEVLCCDKLIQLYRTVVHEMLHANDYNRDYWGTYWRYLTDNDAYERETENMAIIRKSKQEEKIKSTYCNGDSCESEN